MGNAPSRAVKALTSWSQLREDHINGSSSHMEFLGWSDMLPDLLQCISDRLNIRDYFAFRGVCKGWRSAPSGRSDISKFSKDTPWLMLHGFDGHHSDDTFYLYDISYPNCCTISLPHLRGVTFVESKSGWLLGCRNGDIFFYNPFSFKNIDLPKYPKKDINIIDQHCTFSSLPTSPDCTTFVVRRIDPRKIEVSLCRLGDREWDIRVLDTSATPFDHLKVILCCNCLRNGQCGCKNKNAIYIDDFKVRLRYDFMEGDITIFEPTSMAKPKEVVLLREMEQQHWYNWLCKFGEKKGISITYSPLKMKTDSYAGVNCRTRIYTIDGAATSTVLKNLKAVWVEPRIREAFLDQD